MRQVGRLWMPNSVPDVRSARIAMLHRPDADCAGQGTPGIVQRSMYAPLHVIADTTLFDLGCVQKLHHLGNDKLRTTQGCIDHHLRA